MSLLDGRETLPAGMMAFAGKRPGCCIHPGPPALMQEAL